MQKGNNNSRTMATAHGTHNDSDQPPKPCYTVSGSKSTELIANIHRYYVRQGGRVLDATYGRGRFTAQKSRS